MLAGPAQLRYPLRSYKASSLRVPRRRVARPLRHASLRPRCVLVRVGPLVVDHESPGKGRLLMDAKPETSEKPVEVEVELTYTMDLDLDAEELRNYMDAYRIEDREEAAKRLAAEYAEETPLDTWLCEGATYYVRNA